MCLDSKFIFIHYNQRRITSTISFLTPPCEHAKYLTEDSRLLFGGPLITITPTYYIELQKEKYHNDNQRQQTHRYTGFLFGMVYQ